jgi:hypothetical protein
LSIQAARLIKIFQIQADQLFKMSHRIAIFQTKCKIGEDVPHLLAKPKLDLKKLCQVLSHSSPLNDTFMIQLERKRYSYRVTFWRRRIGLGYCFGGWGARLFRSDRPDTRSFALATDWLIFAASSAVVLRWGFLNKKSFMKLSMREG